MARYRRKTYEVEARQFLGGNGPDIVAWMGRESGAYYLGGVTNNTGHWPNIMLPRRDGVYDRAEKGDWVVRYGSGEFLFIQPETFHETFELV